MQEATQSSLLVFLTAFFLPPAGGCAFFGDGESFWDVVLSRGMGSLEEPTVFGVGLR